MTIEEKNNSVIEYLDSVQVKYNRDYPNLISDDKLNRAKNMFLNSPDDLETIKAEIDKIVDQMIEERKMIIDNMQPRDVDELSNFTLDLGTNKNGLYLSQQQIDLLTIVELSSKEELLDFFKTCSQFPNKSVDSIIENFDSMDLESAKRKLYESYTSMLDSYIEESEMTVLDMARSKLKKLGISDIDQAKIYKSFVENGVDKTLQSLIKPTAEDPEGTRLLVQFNRLMKDDFENVKSVGYGEMAALSRLIDRDDSIDSLIITSGKYNNVMFPNGNGKYFDPYFPDRGLHYCASHNLHMRYHSLFDYSHIEKLLASGKTIADKSKILKEMREYVKLSMEYIEKYNITLSDGTKLIDTVEVFNELVEKCKTGDDKNNPYAMKWEKEFGITVSDLMSCFEGVSKPDGVEFMYNETTLTESRKKRDKVENILWQIESIVPGFIDRFGDQAHLSEEDLENNGMEIKETAEMLVRIQNGQIRTGKDLNDNYILKPISAKKIEMTEHDFHFTKDFMERVNETSSKGLIQPNNFETIKKNMQKKISNIYRNAGVIFDRSTYWSIFNGNDHNLVRANKRIFKENKENNKNDNYVSNLHGGTLGNGERIDEVQTLSQGQNKSIIK